MKRYFILFLISVPLFAFGQKPKKESKYDTLLFFNEFMLAGNYSSIAPTHEISGYGNFGFEIGFKHLYREQKKIHFVYGLEFGYTHYYYSDYFPSNISLHENHYINTTISCLNLSNSFNWRFHLTPSKRIFIETGLFIDWTVKRLDGTIKETFSSEFVPFKANWGGPLIGSSLGIGVNLFYKKYEISIKPDIKIYLSPMLRQYGYEFQNIACSRLVLNFRKLKDVETKK